MSAIFQHGEGNLLDARTDALVNAVNTVGVSGKGIALAFRKAYPWAFEDYRRAALAGRVVPGEMYVQAIRGDRPPLWLINFPTKRHWRDQSVLGDIDDGLVDLAKFVYRRNVRSIAIPALGCGNGGLSWGIVRTLIRAALGPVGNLTVILYPPPGETI